MTHKAPQISTAQQSIKTKRYELCLSFITTVLADFDIETSIEHTQTLTFLGDIASDIDTSLDELSLEEKENLYWSFQDLYKNLLQQDLDGFITQCKTFISIHFPGLQSVPNFNRLYSFIQENKGLQLERSLYQFALKTVHTSILKQQAENAEQITYALRQEGQVAVEFLLEYLSAKGLLNGNTQGLRLKYYLISLERMLNLADDLFDSKKDSQSGIIAFKPRLSYYIHFSRILLSQFALTMFRYPLTFSKHQILFIWRYMRLEYGKLRSL